MEKLTFASLAHLPTAVIFVIDPTGLSGEKSTLLAQLNVRKHLKERFPKRPWLDVVSKGSSVFVRACVLYVCVSVYVCVLYSECACVCVCVVCVHSDK
jgi:Nucleolar GTP-binding protein 1 (NOG1)